MKLSRDPRQRRKKRQKGKIKLSKINEKVIIMEQLDIKTYQLF